MIDQCDSPNSSAADEQLPVDLAREESGPQDFRILTIEEVRAVAGGPMISNEP